MAHHVFTLILDRDARPLTEELREAGCGDALFRIEDGVPLAAFFREAPTLQRAIASATREICSTGLDVVGIAHVGNPRNEPPRYRAG